MKHIHIHKEKHNWFDKFVQVFLPIFAVVSWLLTSIKHPEYGLLVAFIAQTLWLYVTYYGWKKANQVGGFITTIFEITIIAFGILNYWYFTN
jgi:Flp pilus assembly pilin Flp